MQLHYQAYGTGPPLVVLHGLFGSLDNWHSISLKLSERFRVLAVDQRNHGRSPHSDEMTYSAMAADVSSLLQHERISSANVMGHSMGGKTAMQMALLFPRQVERLIVVDIAPRLYPPRHHLIIEAMHALDPGRYHTRKQMEEALAPAIPELPLRQFLLKNVRRSVAGTFQWQIGLEEIRRGYSELQRAGFDGTPFSKPTLFLRGERSDFLTEQDLVSIRPLFPNARLDTIPRAGHLVHVENPAAFLAAVSAFLEQPGA